MPPIGCDRVPFERRKTLARVVPRTRDYGPRSTDTFDDEQAKRDGLGDGERDTGGQ